MIRSAIATLKISQKIRYSAILILGITTLGVSFGLALGEWQQRYALKALRYANENEHTLHRLQVSVLSIRSHPQRLLEVLGSQISTQYEFSYLTRETANALKAIETLEGLIQTSTPENKSEIIHFAQAYREAIDDYQAEIATMWMEIDPMGVSPSTLETTREAIFARMATGNLVRLGYRFERLTERVRLLRAAAEEAGDAARQAFALAQMVRLGIVAASLVLSLVAAIAIARTTSRAIAQPLEEVTKTARQVTENGDFSLRVAVSSTDETGILSRSLNELIERVCCLLEEQSARAIELEAAREAAEAANHAKSDFLASMNHELRTPLNGILGYTQILSNDRESFTPEQQRGLDTIHQCGEHLLTLINDVLDLAKIEARKLDLFPQDFHFKAFLEATASICEIKAQQKSIGFKFEYDKTLPMAVYADDKRLRQVLLNLLSNAVKFTDAGCVTFRVDRLPTQPPTQPPTPPPTPPANPDHESAAIPIRFTVRDTGIGLSIESRTRIFQPFEQVAGRERNAEGTGLGLAISRQLVEAMGGSIQLDSQLGEGSCFWFDVHLPPVRTWLETATPQAAKIIGYQGVARIVLVVDDHRENRQVVVDRLEPLGFQVFEASNGRDGLEQAIALRPDVILTDIAMPEMDGLTFIRALRAEPLFEHTSIFAMPATLSKVDREQSLAAGCDIFLPKPIDFNALLSELEQQLQLVWIYDTPQEVEPVHISSSSSTSSSTIAPAASPLPEAWTIPSAAELRPIYHEARGGFVNEIQVLATELKAANPDYTAFADRIISLTRLFQIEALIALLEPHL